MTQPEYEQRFVADVPPLEIRTDESGRRMFRGAFAVFNTRSHDLGGFKEEMSPKAFNRIIANDGQRNQVQAWFNHNPDALLATVRAGTLKIWTDERAAWYEFPYDVNDPDHQRVAAKAERGDLVGSSFGFRASADEWTTDETDYPLRTVTEVSALRDVGPVSTPAYPATETVGALTFRTLSERVGATPEELVAASTAGDLRSFLLAKAGEDAAPEDDAADAQKAADAEPERSNPLPPLAARMPAWYGDYL